MISYQKENPMKKYARYFALTSCAFLITLLLSSGTGQAGTITLVERGTSDYTIVLGADASLTEHHGALELQTFLEMISGCHIPIVQESQNPSGPMIFVGRSAALDRIDTGIDFDGLGDEGLVVKTSGTNLILAGGRLRGSMYAVYAFLEEVLGCRWYTSECSYIPEMPTIAIPELNMQQKPAFVQRDVFWQIARDGDWSARNRVTSASSELDPQRGGKIIFNGVHTFDMLVPPEEHFEDHPEYYSILANRKRTWQSGNLCLTNPEVMKLTARETIEWIERSPGAYAYFVAQNDGSRECQGPHCQKVHDHEGSPSATYVYFANQVSDRVEKVYPDVYIGTLAYRFTEKPPRFAKPKDNVIIRLCNIIGCDAHPLTDCDQNINFLNNLNGWVPIADKIFIWDYVTNFHHYLMPHPNWYAVAEDLKFFRDNGIDGLFMQGCIQTEAAANEDMAAWVQAKLLWNPDLDYKKLMEEFITYYYGPAAEPMREFYNLFLNNILDNWVHFNLYSRPEEEYLHPELIKRAEKMLDEAARAALNDSKAAYRVEEARLGIRYTKLRQPIEHTLDGDILKAGTGEYDGVSLRELEDFMEACKKHEVEVLAESRGMWVRYNEMRANVSDHRLVTLENDDIRVDVIPDIGGRIYRIIDKASGKTVLESGSMMTSSEPLDYVLQSTAEGTKIVMEGYRHYRTDDNAFSYTYEILVPASGARIDFTESLTALQEISRPQGLGQSGGFSIGPFWKLQVGVADADDAFLMEKMPEPKDDGMLRVIKIYPAVRRYYSRFMDNGAWAIYNPEEKIGILNRFNLEDVEECSIAAPRESPHTVSMGISTAREPMKAGEVRTLRHSYEIIRSIKTR